MCIDVCLSLEYWQVTSTVGTNRKTERINTYKVRHCLCFLHQWGLCDLYAADNNDIYMTCRMSAQVHVYHVMCMCMACSVNAFHWAHYLTIGVHWAMCCHAWTFLWDLFRSPQTHQYVHVTMSADLWTTRNSQGSEQIWMRVIKGGRHYPLWKSGVHCTSMLVVGTPSSTMVV